MSQPARTHALRRDFASTEHTVSNKAFLVLTLVFLALACAIARAQSVEVTTNDFISSDRSVSAAVSVLQ